MRQGIYPFFFIFILLIVNELRALGLRVCPLAYEHFGQTAVELVLPRADLRLRDVLLVRHDDTTDASERPLGDEL